MRRLKFLSPLVLGFLMLTASSVFAIPVELELILLVDVSGSVDATEYNLQKKGYVDAFNNPTIQSNIASFASSGGIAVAFAEWSSTGNQIMLVNWTQISTAAQAAAFAAAINATPRPFGGGNTAPGSAVNWGVPLFNNAFEGDRRVIDISGDGRQNDGDSTSGAVAAAYSSGIITNGLAILGEANLQTWYQDNIVTPGHGTLWVANDFGDFGTAVAAKIGQEIVGVPEPATLLVLAGGLLGFGLIQRRVK